MASRIVVFGATGYTGRLVADALVARGARPVLAARNVERLRAVGDELGGLEVAVADVSRPESVRELVGEGDVLVSTVGPFTRWGDPAVEAAIEGRAHYIDSTGEPPFIRRVFERFGARAESAGVGLVTAFGYDWVPGNLAAALALRDAGDQATRVEIGYYMTGDPSGGMSGGTRASTTAAMLEPHFQWRDGALRNERSAARIKSFDVNGKQRPAISIGSSEHFALPRIHPELREVDAYLGWFGPLSRPMQAMSAGLDAITRIPGVKGGFEAAANRFVKGSTGGPDAATRAKSGSHIVARAYGSGGGQLAEVRIVGGNGYEFTGKIIAWGAATAAETGMKAAGALGPVEAFGLDELEAGCREAGLAREG